MLRVWLFFRGAGGEGGANLVVRVVGFGVIHAWPQFTCNASILSFSNVVPPGTGAFQIPQFPNRSPEVRQSVQRVGHSQKHVLSRFGPRVSGSFAADLFKSLADIEESGLAD